MADFDALPFPIGTTLGGTTSASGNVTGKHLEGTEYRIADLDYSSPQGPPRLGNGPDSKVVKIVRNKSGITLALGMGVQYNGNNGREIAGYTTVNGSRPDGIVDEYLTNGCPDGDLCYVTVQGLTLYRVSVTPSEAVINADDYLTCVTAAASTTSTTAGRFTPVVLTGATSVLANQILGAFAQALSASTTNNTGSLKLCRILNRL